MTTDRDQSIERLLRRAPAPGSQAPDACPDAETLAALADDALTAAARREIERHVADCHRCQAVTAAMVRADTAARAAGSPAASPWWKGGAVRWGVPAAAAATAVALWVAIPDQRAPMPTDEPVADTQMAASPTTAPTPEAPAEAPAEAAGSSRREASAAAPAEAPIPASPEASAPAALADRSGGPSQLSREETDSRTAALNESAAPTLERQRTVQAPLNQSARVASAGVGSMTAGVIEVASPDPQRLWRIGPGDAVQHSVDGGATWTRQETGGPATLTAGAAPAPDVCWLVGRGGLVLRTIDGGRLWQRLPFPEGVDLTSVAASSALAAIVNAGDGRRFRTADGGQTWNPVELP